MRRYADFIKFPGTGMWMMCTPNTTSAGMYLYRGLPVHTIKGFVESEMCRLYWIDHGIGASTLLGVREGRKSASATLVTKQILARYLKE